MGHSATVWSDWRASGCMCRDWLGGYRRGPGLEAYTIPLNCKQLSPSLSFSHSSLCPPPVRVQVSEEGVAEHNLDSSHGDHYWDLREEVTCSVRPEPIEGPCEQLLWPHLLPGLHHWVLGHFQSHQGGHGCLFCKKPFPEVSIRPNWVLANLVSSFPTLKPRNENPAQEAWICEWHRERPFFFIQEDQQFLRVVCNISYSTNVTWCCRRKKMLCLMR